MAARAGPYLSNEGFVLLHQFVQVLLVLLKPLQQVRLLVLQQAQLLVSLRDDRMVESPRNHGVTSFPITRHTHHTLQAAQVLQLDLRVLQLLGQCGLDALCLQTSGFAFLQLISDAERVRE